MSSKVFQDNIFPRHISELMNLMHMVVFRGTDGEEKWPTYLTNKQKEFVALGLALYYQCEHCIQHHQRAVYQLLEKSENEIIAKNINSIVLFLRVDTRMISKIEKNHWIDAWYWFAKNIAIEARDHAIADLIGLAIGIARDDDFLIKFCGTEVYNSLKSDGIEPLAAIGELESVVIFMKAAASKNRIVGKISELVQSQNGEELEGLMCNV